MAAFVRSPSHFQKHLAASDAYLAHYIKHLMEFFAKIANGSTTDVWQDSKYASHASKIELSVFVLT